MQLTHAIRMCTGNTQILVELLFKRGLGICANIFVKDFVDSYNSHDISKVLLHFLHSWYALEIVCSCASTQIVSLLNVAFVVFREYSTVSHPPRQSALPLILFSLGQSWVDQRGLYLSTLSQRVAEVDLTHLPLQVVHPWLRGKKAYNAILRFLIKQNRICTSSPYY